MLKAYGKFWKNYVNFKGKASQADYWWVFLVHTILWIIVAIIFAIVFVSHLMHTNYQDDLGGVIDIFMDMGIYMVALVLIFAVFGIATFIPLMSLQIRRFNDLGWKCSTGFLVFLALIVLSFLTYGKSAFLMPVLSVLPSDVFKGKLNDEKPDLSEPK